MNKHDNDFGIGLEQHAPAFAAVGGRDVSPKQATSRRALLAGGTAIGLSLLMSKKALGAGVNLVGGTMNAGAALDNTPDLTARTFSSPRHTTHYWEAGPADGPLMIFLHG